ncbi:hypothetical protein STCU_04021 [Strigomonas culicis]|uniref:PLAC8 family protein n=1 Tax=Strigomonas culicis TaxID=28005 RepID=S9UP39_9TRYP|nr:hypothetical protein STCU_04021 [Strigomonas culicis]|eukprot:EPY30529.1 hypothetical protein STCU_04021 [Strigomonas culicis]
MGQKQCAECYQECPFGILGLNQINWGGQAGAFYECWRVSPCCGAPNLYDTMLCLCHWIFMSPCSSCKLYATSLGDQCSIWPHCFCILCCPVGRLFTRYNLRKRSGARGNMIGDCVCIVCCCPCAWCQELRSVNPSGWRIIPECDVPIIYVPGCRFLK